MARGLLLLLALLAPALAPPAADAGVVTGSAGDPMGDAPAPGVDAVSAAWSFDDAAGRYTVSVTFAAAPDAENWGMINALLRPACDGEHFAAFRGNNRTTAVGATAGNAADGPQPDGSTGPSVAPATNVKSDEGRTTTLETSHERLVGRTAGCVTITISHNGVLDTLTLPATGSSGTPTSPPAPPSPGNPATRPAAPSDVRLGTGRRLRFKRNRARLALTGLAAGMRSDLRLRLPNGTTIASGRYVARLTQPALVTLTLTKKGRRWLRAHRRGGRARLSIRTSHAGAAFERRYAMRVR